MEIKIILMTYQPGGQELATKIFFPKIPLHLSKYLYLLHQIENNIENFIKFEVSGLSHTQ